MQNVFFNPDPSTFYKILSVMDGTKAFTVNQAQELKLQDFTGSDSQKFHVYLNNGKYAFVAPNNSALYVVNDSAEDGATVKLDGGQHKTSFFEIAPVTTGQWAGKACTIKTANGKVLDIYGAQANNGADIKQWEYHGNANQCWVVTPVTAQLQPVQPPVQPQQQQQQQQQQQGALADVPSQFAPVNGTDYRIVSVLNTNKALTVNKENKLVVSDYTGDATQKFKFFQNGTKVAFVVQSTNTGLCVYMDSKDDGAVVQSDPGQHPSSWFDIVRNTQGQYLNKGYVIKTHAGKAIDIDGANLANGNKVHQWDSHNEGNQTWLIIPANQPLAQQQQQPVQPVQPVQPQQDQQGQFADVPAQFTPVANTDYRVVTILNSNKALTVTNQGKLTISDYVGDATQKFKLYQNGAKFAFVVQSSNTGLCVNMDSKDDGADLKSDPGQHPSSWFDITKNSQGKYPNKGYLINSHAGKSLDIQGGSSTNGSRVSQYGTNYGPNQTWIIVPASQPLPQQQQPVQPVQPVQPIVPGEPKFTIEPVVPIVPGTTNPQQQQGFFPGFNAPQFTGVMNQWGQSVQPTVNDPKGWGQPGWGQPTANTSAQGWGQFNNSNSGWGQGNQQPGFGQGTNQGWGNTSGNSNQGWGHQGWGHFGKKG